MQISKELFNIVEFSQVFNILDLRFNYHQLLLFVEDQVKTIFWGVNQDYKDQFFY